MTGEHLARLHKAVAPMNRGDVVSSRMAWSAGYTNLDGVALALENSREGIRKGFGEGSDVTRTALAAITTMHKKVNDRKVDMYDATLALDDLLSAMSAAKGVATSVAGATDPGDPPSFPSVTTGDETDEIRALKIHSAQTRVYNARAAAYAADDAEAERALRDLNTAYDAAIPVFAKIHGEPVEEPGRTPSGTGPGGLPGGVRPPTYTPPPGLVGVDPGDPRDPDLGDPGDVDTDEPDFPDVDPVDPVDPGGIDPGGIDPGGIDPGGPGGPGGAGGPGGINPGLVGGGLLAGGLVGPGAISGIRGLLARGGLSGGAPAIGASTRAGGPGSLGRGGLAPGTQAGRGAGGRGGGRGAGGRGVPGSQGGRGGRSGRGAAGAAGGRNGRRRDEEREGADRELYDDGQDWLDDEGTGPGVLG